LTTQLRYEALAGYDKIGKEKKPRNLWVILLVAALVILLISVLGVFQRLQYIQRQSLIATEGYKAILETQIQEMGAASGAWETAASLIKMQAITETANVFVSATAAELDKQAQATSIAATASANALTATASINVCEDLRSSTYEIISGPELNPKAGTILRQGSLASKPAATWVIKNTGSCSWKQVLLWSTVDNNIVQPILKKNGAEVSLISLGDTPLLAPGEQVEIMLQFDPSNIKDVQGDWVIVVNGLTLNSQPHLLLDVKNWVVTIQDTSTPTRLVRTPKATPNTTSESPPVRVTDTPPSRP
jgi:hypothetical protein